MPPQEIESLISMEKQSITPKSIIVLEMPKTKNLSQQFVIKKKTTTDNFLTFFLEDKTFKKV